MNALILRRRAIAKQSGGGGILPSGYTAYDWVQTNEGTPAIDTQYSMSFPRGTFQQRYEIEGKFANSGNCPRNYDRYIIFASSVATYDGGIGLTRMGNNARNLGFFYNNKIGTDSAATSIGTITYGEWHDFKLTYKNEESYGGLAIIDGETISSSQSSNNETTSNLRILGIAETANAYPCRLARLKVYEYGVLVCDLVPAKRDSDEVVGFYDVVRKLFLSSSIEGATLLCGYGFEDFT